MKMVLTVFIVVLAILVALTIAPSVFAQFPDQWTRDPANPVLSPGGEAEWDSTMVFVRTVVFHEGTYKAWFEGDNGIGYATSPDGRDWQKYPNNPVLVPGPDLYDVNGVEAPSVVIVDGIYHMWYACVSNNQELQISYATSNDGINWEKYSVNPVMELGDPGDLDSRTLFSPVVIYEEPYFRMWYNGHDDSSDDTPQRILYAESFDGVDWARYPVAALEPGNPGDWDEAALLMKCVLPLGCCYYMFYTGADVDDQGNMGVLQIGYATSPDGVNWIKRNPSEPVFNPGEEGTWDSLVVGGPSIMQTDTEFIMWYVGSNDFEYFQTGVATASFPPDAVPEGISIRLDQNYPNPFNPQTTIAFDLTSEMVVSLRVYDVAGRLIRNLVDGEVLEYGHHKTIWNSSDDLGRRVASGTYFYRLEAGDFLETKRMVLVK